MYILFLIILLIPLQVIAADAPAPVFKTGQTRCYGNDRFTNGHQTNASDTIDCTGTGHDGEYQMGIPWPDPRFKVNSDQTITDNLTGLIWPKNPYLKLTRDPTYYTRDAAVNQITGDTTWQEAFEYIKKLNTEKYLGFDDWRMPNQNELNSLENMQVTNNLGDWLTSQGFKLIDPEAVLRPWSSTTNISTASNKKGWQTVWPVRGNSQKIPKTGQNTCYNEAGAVIDCADTGQDGELQLGIAWPDPRFTDNGDQTITDNLTGLIWAKNANPLKVANSKALPRGVPWQTAINYVKKLNTENYLGFNDWRMPNRSELISLFNFGVANSAIWLNSLGFNNVSEYPYWVSTSRWGGSTYSFNMGKNSGDVRYKSYPGPEANSEGYLVWPVRGGK